MLTFNEINFGDLHPIDTVEKFVAETGWNYTRRNESLLCFERWGAWNRYDFAVGVRSSGSTIVFCAEFNLPKPNKMVRLPLRFYELLNLVNQNTLLGMYAYVPACNSLCWSYGLLQLQYGEFDLSSVEALIDQALSEIDTRYPAFQLVLTPGITAQEAFDNAIPEPHGRA